MLIFILKFHANTFSCYNSNVGVGVDVGVAVGVAVALEPF